MRDSKPPRNLILSTGEEIPRGHSIRARLFILEIEKGAILPDNLTACQKDARAGLYAEAMGGFVQSLASRYEELKAAFDASAFEFREKVMGSLTHARTPDILASLQAGFELFLDFCCCSGAIDQAEREHLSSRCWGALCTVALTQSKHHAATEPTARFLELLRASLASGRAHLQSREGTMPEGAQGACGWRLGNGGVWSPSGECVGWVVGDDHFLEPAAAYRVVQIAARDMGEPLSASEQTLKKRLHERGLLASIDRSRETLTVRRSLAGSTKHVLHLMRSTLIPDAPDDSEEIP